MLGNSRLSLTLILIVLGAGWGMTIPLTKITVTGGYDPLGMIVWQFAIGIVVLGVPMWRRLFRLRITMPMLVVWLFIATIGTLIPNAASYRATFHLPAGVMAIVIASVSMFAFPLALLLGTDRFSARRLCGLALGLGGVALIALPEASLPERAMIAFLPLALLAPFCYAVEGNVVAKWGTAGLDPIQVMFGAMVLGLLIALPLALATDQMRIPRAPFSLADATLITAAIVHVGVYTSYVWLIGKAGAVFAGQVSYLVTGFGVMWSILMLGEVYSLWVWAALVLMALGLTLVAPRMGLAEPDAAGDTGAA